MGLVCRVVMALGIWLVIPAKRVRSCTLPALSSVAFECVLKSPSQHCPLRLPILYFYNCTVQRVLDSAHHVAVGWRYTQLKRFGAIVSISGITLDQLYLFGSPNKSPNQQTLPNPKRNYIGGSR